MDEVWKDIDGYEGRYQVSNLGDVRTLRFNPPRSMYQSVTNVGYKQVKLYKDYKCWHVGVHVLVARAFVDGYEDGLEVNHKDLDKTNNVYTNLEWVTRSENQKHQYKLRNKNYEPNTCPICGKEISKKSKTCMEHAHYDKFQEWEEMKENLIEDLKHLNFLQIAKKYGYSDGGIRKMCKRFGLPSSASEAIEYRKKNGTYVPSKNSLKKTKQERYVHYEVDGILDTATGWCKRLGLEQKRIGRYAKKHTYDETIEYIKSFM